MKNARKKTIALGILIFYFAFTFSPYLMNTTSASSSVSYTEEVYTVKTDDGAAITLYRYVGNKRPSLMLVPGICCNHYFFDFDDNHSLAKFLAAQDWDVWMLDARTHDGDGDFAFGEVRGLQSDREWINRYWDLDRTYLKQDIVAAAEFIKKTSNYGQFCIIGHSLGGYLAYAYAELVRQDDLAGIITLGSSAYANPFINPWYLDYSRGFRIGQRAYVRPFGETRIHITKYYLDKLDQNIPGQFYQNTTSAYVWNALKYKRDDEAAGLYVDMMFGRDPRYYNYHWVDPQTLHDYTAHLSDITVPFLAIAGNEDGSDPKADIFSTYQNVSSAVKKCVVIPGYAHMDLLLGDTANIKVFPEITTWLDSIT